MDLSQEPDQVSKFTKMLGIFFVATGAALLITIVITFGQLLTDPDSVLTVQLFTEFLQSDAPPFTMTIEGREAIINIDPDIRVVLAAFVGAVSILALGSMLHACIGGGLALLKFAGRKSGASDVSG